MNLENKLIYILALFVLGCAPPLEQTRWVDPILEPYVSKFESIYGAKISIPVTIGVISSKWAGLCRRWTTGEKLITIQASFVDISNPGLAYSLQLEQVVFHELGHCVLNLEHNDVLIEGTSIPSSIMNSFGFGNSRYYRNNTDYYYNELFGRL